MGGRQAMSWGPLSTCVLRWDVWKTGQPVSCSQTLMAKPREVPPRSHTFPGQPGHQLRPDPCLFHPSLLLCRPPASPHLMRHSADLRCPGTHPAGCLAQRPSQETGGHWGQSDTPTTAQTEPLNAAWL